MKRLVATFLALSAVLSGIAFAGSRNPLVLSSSVYIETAGRYASAAFGEVRSSSNPNEYVNCAVSASANGYTASCLFKNVQGTYGSCYFTSGTPGASGMLSALATLNDDSYVAINWDANSQCTFVLVMESSYTGPKVP